MFEILVDDGFARWFEGLSAPLAERVAAALELSAATAPRLDPGKHSRLLLWFDGTQAVTSAAAFQQTILQALPSVSWLAPYRELVQWQHEALRCLETPEVERALIALSTQASLQALTAIAELRACLSATRAALGLALARPPLYRGTPPDPNASIVEQSEKVKQHLRAALTALGLDPDELPDDRGGLRELSIDDVTPRLRIIYGLDPKAEKLLALSGDTLERAYYGDSVRWAERRWQRYQTQRWLTLLGVAANEDA